MENWSESPASGQTPAGRRWAHSHGHLDLARVRVMAIVNLTPDSFFDGGRWMAQSQRQANGSVVVSACRRWAEQGADVFDLGGESTRPGSAPVDIDTELARVLPVVERLRADEGIGRVPISIDTRHAEVARLALARGAAIVNDVSGLADPAMADVVAAAQAGLVIGHMRGEPATMQHGIEFADLLGEVIAELAVGVDRARRAGVDLEAIVVDPCLGFGKTPAHSAALCGASRLLERELGCPVVIGASRKSFLAQWAGDERLLASIVAGIAAVGHGARILRVHDVAETVEAVRIHEGIVSALAREQAVHRGGQR